jgi:hypothetical protein
MKWEKTTTKPKAEVTDWYVGKGESRCDVVYIDGQESARFKQELPPPLVLAREKYEQWDNSNGRKPAIPTPRRGDPANKRYPWQS